MKPLGLGIIGLHHQHARWYNPLWSHLREDFRPVAIAEADADFLASENAFFGYETTGDYRDLLERDDIDVVIIWLPHAEMPRAVADAAAAGKHVIVEKPCCATLEGARSIVETAARCPEIKISAPYCWRTHLVSAEIKRAVADGLLGQVTALEARLNAGGAYRYVRDSQLWMLDRDQGGGPMWNLGVHWIDFFRWLTGEEIVEVCGMLTPPIGEPKRSIEDGAQALLKFESGATAMLEASYTMKDAYPGKRDIAVSVRGTQGSASWAPAWEGTTDRLLLVSENARVETDQRCRTIEIVSPEIPGYCGHMAWAWLKDFARCVRDNDVPQIGPTDILAAVKVADAIYRSVESGCMMKV